MSGVDFSPLGALFGKPNPILGPPGGPDVPKPAKIPDVPKRSDPEVQAAADRERARRIKTGGRASTKLTGPLGLLAPDDAESPAKTLLGGR